MKTRPINSGKSPQPSGAYAQSIEVSESSRTLYISGQIPVSSDDRVPFDFEDQARLVWSSISNQLEAADMSLINIVKHTTFLADRKYCDANSKIRQEVLGGHKTALTIIITDIYDENWLLEVEAIAMA